MKNLTPSEAAALTMGDGLAKMITQLLDERSDSRCVICGENPVEPICPECKEALGLEGEADEI